jgi:NADP-dependent 3-hydroxy acid dehydrogenase YdfG
MSIQDLSSKSDLASQVAVITGASSGLGEDMAMTLAREGIHVVLAARRLEKLQALAEKIQQSAPANKTLVIQADVSRSTECERVVQETLNHFGRLDILINNAGMAPKISLLQETSIEQIDQTIDLNLKGAIYLMKYALAPMVSQQNGTIININSVAGKTAYPYWSVYDASKFGLRAITEAVAEEQSRNNIKVVGIYPGAINTPIWDSLDLAQARNGDGMLDARQISEAVLYVLKQPLKVFIPEITLKPLHPVL